MQMNEFNNEFYNEQQPQIPAPHIKTAKKAFSSIGFSICMIIAVVYAVQIIVGIILLNGFHQLCIASATEGTKAIE